MRNAIPLHSVMEERKEIQQTHNLHNIHYWNKHIFIPMVFALPPSYLLIVNYFLDLPSTTLYKLLNIIIIL